MAGIKKGKGKGEIPAHKNAKGVPDMSMLLGFEWHVLLQSSYVNWWATKTCNLFCNIAPKRVGFIGKNAVFVAKLISSHSYATVCCPVSGHWTNSIFPAPLVIFSRRSIPNGNRTFQLSPLKCKFWRAYSWRNSEEGAFLCRWVSG